MLDSHERLTIIYGTHEYSALYKFRCPYKGCPTLGKERSRIYRHIREVHTPDFPPISTRRGTHICRCARTKKGIILSRGEEPFMENGDPVEVVYMKELETLDLFYCPFRDCTAGCYRRKTYVLRHIRQKHDPCFAMRASRNPPTIYIGPPERRRIIDFTALFRGTVNLDEKLTWE
ncbi:hypothetical protein BJV82DRAFT_292689 [Fennellomyces sp. T-0311]|nr:hypothetical protein BJV82DRAFT_292689 [Fennellomyces sp. T-0311]